MNETSLNASDASVQPDPAHAARTAPAASRPERRRRLLVVAYYYPPMGMTGVLRIAKFTKHLRSYGWDPTVLTVGDVGYFAYDYSLLEEVLEAGVTIERTRTFDPLWLLRRRGTITLPGDRRKRMISGMTHVFLQPDNKIGWKRHAVERGMKLAEEQPFDAVLATAPPFTSFLVGLELHRRLGLPLVVDYRDPWLDNADYFYATPMHRGYAAGLEESVLKNADAVVVINRKIKERLIARYPFLTHEGVHIIPSGFDAQDVRIAARYPLERPDRMRITYAGLFSSRRSPKVLFDALAAVFARHPETRGAIEFCVVGTFNESFAKMAAAAGVATALTAVGAVEHHEKMRYLLSSDLLVVMTNDPVVTPGKVYEYIGTRRPILALAPEGGLRGLFAGYGAATCVGPSDTAAVADAIYTTFQQWRAGTLPRGDAEVAHEYEQRNLTERLARVLAYSLRI